MQSFEAEGETPSDPEHASELTATQEQTDIVEALETGNLSIASDLCLRKYGQLVGRYCMAVLGEREQAEACAREVVETTCGQWNASKPELPTIRAYLLAQAKKRCAIQMSLQKTDLVGAASGAVKTASDALHWLRELRPSGRELLVLRYVSKLSYVEISRIFGWDDVETRRRLSSAIIDACYAAESKPVPSFVSEERKAFLEQLVNLIDGSASTELRHRVVENDALRDELHVATQVTRRLARAADDYPTFFDLSSKGNVELAPSVTEPIPKKSPELTRKDTPGQGNIVPIVAPLPKKTAWLVAALATAMLTAIAVAFVGVGRRTSDVATTHEKVTLTLAKIERNNQGGRVELCTTRRQVCRDASEGATLSAGEVVRTSDFATARLDVKDLGVVVLEPDTVLTVDDDQRSLRLDRGRFRIDVSGQSEARLDLRTKGGILEAVRGKFVVVVEPERTLLEVSRGEVALSNEAGQRVAVHEGEQGLLEGKAAPSVFARTGQSIGLAVDELADEPSDPEALSRGLGELVAKKPGETKERTNAVRLSRHRVSVRIVGAIARTEIEETFTNDTKDVLEGVFRFPLPSDAQVERLALDVDGRLVEGAFVDRERAAAIWRGNIVNAAPQMRQQIKDDIVWVPGPWRDPALLEWQRGNRFELRIYPIPKQGQRRIVLAYTQVLPEAFGRRQYSYPLPMAGRMTGAVEDFSVDLELRNHDPNVKPLVRGYEVEQRRDEADVTRLRLLAQRFLPKGDFGVEFALRNRNQSLQAWAYLSGDDRERPYAALLLRPQLPTSKSSEARDFAFILDVSRSMVGEDLRRATQIVSRTLRELSPDDRVTLLACDSDCRTWSEGLVSANAATAASAERWLTQWTADGASDPAFAIESAMRAVGGSPNRRIELVYVGDGTATVGAVRPAALEHYVHRVVEGRNVQVTAVAVGTDSDLPSLRALARGGRGTVVPYVPGNRVSQVSRAMLLSILGNHLSDVTLELPTGMSLESQPEQVIVAGSELLIPARLTGSMARGDVVLRGRIADQPFEQRYPIELEAISGERHAFVPRLYAAERIAELDGLGDERSKQEAIELSRRFSVASRHTSLLVLESSAMFKAFGLDNQRQVQSWTGELESEATVADAESQVVSAAASYTGPSGGAKVASAAAPQAPVAAKAQATPPPSVARDASSNVNRKAGQSSGSWALEDRSIERTREAEVFAERPLRMESEEPLFPPRRMVPMRRIWERHGEVRPRVRIASVAKPERILMAETEQTRFPDRRSTTKALFDLYVAGDEQPKAEQLAQRWNERDPMDVEAIVARADMAASRGERALAIRILGSVVDVRPGDVGAQQRLMRLYRWQGQDKTACRFAVALATFRSKDAPVIADALRCTQVFSDSEPQFAELRREIQQGMDLTVVQAAERLATKTKAADELSGDLQVFAKWDGNGDVDLDVALIDPDGHRISWLGAPSRSVISALHVVSKREESLSLRGGKPGEYVIEVTRVKDNGNDQVPVSGRLEVVVAGYHKTIPFELRRESERLGLVTIKQVAKLVPLRPEVSWVP